MATETTAAQIEIGASDRLINRELSWLDFNARVLQLAADPAIPLLERVRFASIFSSNLDEFFMVRVAGLMRQAASGIGLRSADGRTPQATLADIRERVIELGLRQSELWTNDLRSALAREGILIGTVDECTEEELAELRDYFDREVLVICASCSRGPRPSAPRTPSPMLCRRFSPATRTMKNSSRLLAKIARNLARSSNGVAGSSASVSTRPLKSSQDSSRLR
jgi:polyphosphate kinase